MLEMRRHYANYLRGISHMKEWRMKLVTADTAAEIEVIFDGLLRAFCERDGVRDLPRTSSTYSAF